MLNVENRREDLKNAWHKFVTTGQIEPSIRPVIAESWLRCRNSGLSPNKKLLNRAPLDFIEKEIEANQKLIATCVPSMKELNDFVRGSGFLISLSSNNGMILHLEGNEVDKKAGVRVGDLWTEELTGTNAIHLCLLHKKPIQVFAHEHYLASATEWTSSSAPIFNENNELLGVLSITGEYAKVHVHTLGMVVAAVNAIQNSLKMQNSLEAVVISDTYKTAIMESIDEGILALNNDQLITHININAKKILKITQPVNMIIGQPLNQVLDEKHPLLDKIKKYLQPERLNPHVEDPFLIDQGSFTVTAKVILSPSDYRVTGLVLVLREITLVKTLVNKMVGARASFTFDDLIGKNRLFLETINLAKMASASESNVLLSGESGTGKELFAQAIHNLSERRNGPFLAVNCAALPRSLIESELFGYAEGAFTGAKKGGNPGKFELAEGGTMFLDEIGEMPLEIQATLLRVLQESNVVRIGGKEVIPINVRIIAATNKNLEKEIRLSNFRKDLYYRLNVMGIGIPPLRDRDDDIPLLTQYFVNKFNLRLNKQITEINPEVIKIFQQYHWPGNVRELQNIIERAINVAEGSTIFPHNLPGFLRIPRRSHEDTSLVPLRQYEKELIIRLLREYKGNRTAVSSAMGISRTSLYRKFREYGIKD